MKLSLVIGRFQPMHNGHLKLIEKAREHGDKTLVLIGSSRQLTDFKNPLTFNDRVDLLNKVLPEGDDVLIRSLPDSPTDDEWIQDVIAHVLSLEEDPTQVTLWCHPKDYHWYTQNLLYAIESVYEVDISATRVRHAWYTEALWTVKDYLPEATLELLRNHVDLHRLSTEYMDTTLSELEKTEGHPFGNPIEPVTFAVIIQEGKVLVGERGGSRGNGQYGLPGGFLDGRETTLDGCMRETKEELGIDLKSLIVEGKAQCLAQAVEENTDDLGTRTLGVNYLFLIKPGVKLEITPDGKETLSYKWVSLKDVVDDKQLLFYNHNLVTKRLLSKVGGK